jgi:hypothetical protein|tara:strand:- start:2229 stop:2486 length:258 start_codon:yes stop_codon:yes gene_type:complete
MDLPTESPAERMYKQHQANCKKYQQKNKEKMSAKQKKYIEGLKGDPEKYKTFLEKRRNYYKDVLKPRKEQKLEEAHESKPTTLVI